MKAGFCSSTKWLTTAGPSAYVVFNHSVEQGGRPWPTTSCPESSPLSPIRRGATWWPASPWATPPSGSWPIPTTSPIQAVSKHIKVLADAGLVSQSKDAQRRPCHLEAEVFDLMTKWIERYRQQAQERYERLDAVLAEMRGDERPTNHRHREQGAAS